MEIFRQSRELLRKTEAGCKPVRLAGISVSNLQAAGSGYQLDLFGKTRQRERRRDLNEAVDLINQKFGEKTINPASLIGVKERK